MISRASPTEEKERGKTAFFDLLTCNEEIAGFADLRLALEKKAPLPCLTKACYDLKLMPTIRALVEATPDTIKTASRALFGQLVDMFFSKIDAKNVIKQFLKDHPSSPLEPVELALKTEMAVKQAFSSTLEVYIRKVLQHLIAAEARRIGMPSIRQFNLLIWGALDDIVDKRVPMLVAEAMGFPVFKRYQLTLRPSKEISGKLLPVAFSADPKMLAA